MSRRLRTVSAVSLALLALASCKPGSRDPRVVRAWVRLPAVAGQPAAGYLDLHAGARARRLVRVESAVAERVELHASMKGMRGMTTMAPLPHLAVPGGGVVRFAPGGRHLMLFGLDPAITPGTAVPLRFGFADGTTAEAEAKTVAAGDDAPY